MRIEELTTKEIEKYLETKNAVLIPVGSMEQHGAHLPLGTGTFLADHFVDKISDLTETLMLPVLHYTPCPNSSSFAGTVSISTRILYDLVMGILQPLYAQGFRRFFLISGKGEQGQLVTLREAGGDLMRSREDVSVHVISTYHANRVAARALLDVSHEFHAGAVETSLMLYLRPDLVKPSTFAAGKNHLPEYEIVRDKKKYWESGVSGNPAAAAEELGRHIFERTVEHIRKYVLKHTY